MANPKESIWGAPSTWIYSLRQSGLETTTAKLGHFDKPKTAYFGTGGTSGYEGSLLRAINVSQKLVANEFLDESICPCGQDSAVSPWGKIAIFNKSNNGSLVPEIQDFSDRNINWFFADKASTRPLFYRQIIRTHSNFMPYEQYAPKQPLPVTSNNAPVTLCPYVSWGLKSLLLTIEVGITLNDANPISGSLLWVTLDDWKNNYSTTHYMAGLRFFVRGCTAINSTTLALTYNDDGALPAGNGCSGLICPMNKIKVKNGGEEIPTQFLYFMGYASTTRRAHIFTPTEQIINDSSTANAPALGVLPCWNYFQNQTIQVYHPYSTDYYYYYKIPYSDDTYNKVMAIAALFGCFFTPTNKYVFDYDMLDTDLYLPIIDENGVAHGEYTKGSNNANNPLYSKNSIREIDYDPDAPPPHNRYYDHTDLPTGSGTASNWYSDRTTGTLTPHMVLGNLFNAIAEIADNPNNQQFLFQEPLKNILDYRRILLTQPWGDRPAGGTTVIPLGSFTTAGTEYPFTGYKNFPRFRRVTLGSFSFDREFNNFLDFEPYTQAILYVPYCGVKHLPMNIFAGHTVNIYMNADNTSGVLQVLIFVDNIEWGTLSGMASEELPLVGETALTAANTKRELDYQQGQLEWSKMIGIGGSVAGASISAANKNPAGLIAQGASALFKNYYYNTQQAELQYQINHTKPEPLTIQKGDSSIDKMNVQYPFIMIQSPVIIGGETSEQINSIMQTFGHTKGFKCCETGVIGDFSGLTKCSTANLNGISCTYTEKKMIMEALQEGVIL